MLGIRPKNIRFYQTALIHRSVSRSLLRGAPDNNERLEYLGDAIISAAVAEYLFKLYPHKQEGFLSQMRSRIVSRKTLNIIAQAIGVEKHIVTRQGVNISGNKNLFGNTIEALIGAVFLDKGYCYAKKVFIENLLMKHVDLDRLESEEVDYKSRLIEWGQKQKQPISISCTETTDNPDFPKGFIATITLDDEVIAKGSGTSKKEAEQDASHAAWDYILSNPSC